MSHEAKPASPNPLGSEGRDGAFDFARNANFSEAVDRSTPSLDHILAELPKQFRAAMQAEAAFSNWSSKGDRSIAEVARRLRDLIVAGQPYAHSYQAIEEKFHSHSDEIHDRLRAEVLRDDASPGELIEGEGSPGLTITAGEGHA